MTCEPVRMAKRIASAPGCAFAALIASRSVQFAAEQPPSSKSAAELTVKTEPVWLRRKQVESSDVPWGPGAGAVASAAAAPKEAATVKVASPDRPVVTVAEPA